MTTNLKKIPDAPISKRPIYLFGTLLLIAYLLIVIFMFQGVKATIVENKLSDLNQEHLYQKSLRQYVSTQLKPVFFKLQNEHILNHDFFDSRALSGTYITRNVYEFFDERLEVEGLTSWQYRLAAKSPRNLINKATEEELALLERFNQDRELTTFQEIRKVAGETILYVASPIGETTASCLLCHGQPSWAPKDLVEKYGVVNGFNEQVGEIRAFISYSYALDNSFDKAQIPFFMISLVILLFLVIIFGLVTLAYMVDQKKKRLELKLHEELEFIAHHDQLTQLLNRHALNRDFTALLSTFHKRSDNDLKGIFVMMLDIDFFKSINDVYGHDVGDVTLQSFSNVLLANIKGYNAAKAYRLGGEEFLLVLPNAELSDVKTVYKSIQSDLLQMKIEKLQTDVKVSAGATAVLNGDKQYDALKRVDKRLYEAKRNGRNQLVIDE